MIGADEELSRLNLPGLPSQASPYLKSVLARLEESWASQEWGRATNAAAEALEFLLIAVTASALKQWMQLEPLPPEACRHLVPRPSISDWQALLSLAQTRLKTAGSLAPPEDLALADWHAGLFLSPVLAQPSAQRRALKQVLPALQAWLEKSLAFFESWRETPEGISAEEVDLAPFLMVADCQDCDEVLQPFVYAGLGTSGAEWRSLHLGHVRRGPLSEPFSTWPTEAATEVPSSIPHVHVPYAADPFRLPPEPELARFRRFLAEETRGFLLLQADSGVGKTWLLQFLQADRKLGASVLVAPLYGHHGTSAWLQDLDQALHCSSQPPGFRLPAREVALDIVARHTNPADRFHAYLLALVRLNRSPILLILDAPEASFEDDGGLAGFLPGELPEKTFVAICYEKLGAKDSEKVESLRHGGAQTMAMDPQAPPNQDLLRRFLLEHYSADESSHLTRHAHNRFLGVRILDVALQIGLFSDAEHATQDVSGCLQALKERVGPEAFGQQYLQVLLCLAATPEPVPLRILEQWNGRTATLASRLSQMGWLLREEPAGLTLVHGSVSAPLVQGYPDGLAQTCQRLVWWGWQAVLNESPDVEFARRHLIHWALESRDSALLLRLLQSDDLQNRLHEAIDRAGRRLASSSSLRCLLADWSRALIRMVDQEGRTTLRNALAGVLIRRGRLTAMLGELGAAELDFKRAVDLLTTLVQEGQTEARERLADALAMLGFASTRLNKGITGREVCFRSLELYRQLEDASSRPLFRRAHARAAWYFALAESAEGTSGAAREALEQALHLCSGDAQDLEVRRDRPGMWADLASLQVDQQPEVACQTYDVAIGALEELIEKDDQSDLTADLAAALGGRSLALDLSGGSPLEDLERAVQLISKLVEGEARLDLVPDLALSHHELGSLYSSRKRFDRALEHHRAAIRMLATLVEDEGRLNLRQHLARAWLDRGVVSAELKELSWALEDYTRAIDLLTILVERERRTQWEGELARAYNNRGQAFATLGDLDRALKDFHFAVQHYDVLVERQGWSHFRRDLALAHFNRGGIFRRQENYPQALLDYGHAVDAFIRMQGEEDDPELLSDLAAALTNRGITCAALEDLPAAIRDYGQALKVCSRLQESGQGLQTASLHQASAYHNRGNAYADYGDRDKALKDYSQAISHYTDLVESHAEGADRLALLYTQRGATLAEGGAPDKAWDDLRRAVELYRALLQKDDPLPLRRDLALALARLGHASRELGESDAALAAYRESIHHYEGMRDLNPEDPSLAEDMAAVLHARGDLRLEVEGPSHALQDLERASVVAQVAEKAPLDGDRLRRRMANICTSRSTALLEMGDFDGALQEATKSLDAWSRLSDKSDRTEAERGRAAAHGCRGQAYHRLDNLSRAVEEYGRVLEIFIRLVEEEKRLEFCPDLAQAYASRASATTDQGDFAAAIEDCNWAVDLLRELVDRQGREDLQGNLASTYVQRGRVLLRMDRSLEALENLQAAADIYTTAVEQGRSDLVSEMASVCSWIAGALHLRGELERAQEYWRRATETLASRTAVRSHRTARVWRELMQVAEAMGDGKEAAGARNHAIDILQELVEKQRRQERVSELVTLLRTRAATFRQSGEKAEALADLTAVIDLVKDDETSFSELVLTCTQRATLLNQMGRGDDAMEDYRRGIDAFQGLFKQTGSEDDDPRWEMRNEKARLHNNLALLLDARQDPEALTEFARAIELRSALVERSGHLEVRTDLAFTYNNRGSTHANLGNLALALEDFNRSIELYRLAGNDVEVDLAMVHNNCGQTLVDLERTDEALQHFTRSIDLITARTQTGFRNLLALSFFNRACALESCGRLPEARADFQEAQVLYQILVEREGRLDLSEDLRACEEALSAG